jgi:uncharacterized membrane protein
MLVVLIIRWFQMRERLATIEARLDALTNFVHRPQTARPEPTPPRPEPMPAPPPLPVVAPVATPPLETTPPASAPEPQPVAEVVVERPAARPAPIPWTDVPRASAPPPPSRPAEPAAARSRTSDDWEALLGGNWMNKAGVFVVVIGLALLLNYAYTHIGPAGRVALSYTGAFAMLMAGIWVERREQYRTFAYGLIGGGWAALYLTTYAMHAITAARVIESPLVAGVLLLIVAAGMIAHSLRYRSQTVTALAYFIAFVTLAIGEVTTFSVTALVPLAGSLLYIARRNQWDLFARLGLIATYATVAVHKDTGSPLWIAQALFLVYWLLFEGFDLIRPDAWLLPLNGVGFLLLSGAKWSHAAPQSAWMFATGAAALYLGSTVVRARSGRWRAAVTFNAALAAAAILLKLEHHWAAVALLALGEAYYLAGVRFRSAYLRLIAGAMFAGELGYLVFEMVRNATGRPWEPVALASVVAFYVNRALRPADAYYGYVAAALAATVTGWESPEAWRGRVWSLMAAVPFAFGWWRKELDFRLQGYGLAVLGAGATALYGPLPAGSLAVGAFVAYALVQCVLRSGEDRFFEMERTVVRMAASAATVAGLATLVWRLVPGDWLGFAWIALALALLEAGLRKQPADFRRLAYAVAVLGAGRAILNDLDGSMPLAEAALLYGFAARDLIWASFPATFLLMAGLHTVLPGPAVTAAWGLTALALNEFDRRSLRAQSFLVAGAVFARAVMYDLEMPSPVIAIAPAIACFEAAMLRRPQGSRTRMFFSLAGTALAAVLIFHEVSGSILTIAWGMEGVALLAAGFALRDRVLRLSGLAMLAACTGKLFFWDLRNLDTLPRILSFIVLGLLLVAVSWVYTRFRDQVRRIL